jgi:hypothetical protein
MLVRDQRRVTEERALICLSGCAVPRPTYWEDCSHFRSVHFSSHRAFANDSCRYTASWAVYILRVLGYRRSSPSVSPRFTNPTYRTKNGYLPSTSLGSLRNGWLLPHSQWQYRSASPMDGTQLRIYDNLCNGARAECPPDSRNLRTSASMDPALGYSHLYGFRARMAQCIYKGAV